jgi:hypothetical protein
MRSAGERRHVCLPVYKHLAVILSGRATIEAGDGRGTRISDPLTFFCLTTLALLGTL